MIKSAFFVFCILLSSALGFAQNSWSERMALSFMQNHQDSIVVKPKITARWDYEQGLMLKALEKVWRKTADPKYFNYIQNDLDRYVTKDGDIRTYDIEDYNLDNIATGRALLMLYHQSLPDKEKYRKAADLLWQQLEEQPLTKEGGYWHKKRYPFQMWLDGLFMAEPFSAEYSKMFNHPEHFDHIVRQFSLIDKYAVDPKTGLIYHGYDESREQKWADKQTGLSEHFWGRAIGWYAMALVEVLDYLPEEHPGHSQLISYLQKLAPALVRYQDTKSGVWYQMTALAGKEGNYLEASSSCMFTYALLKGVRMGYLDTSFRESGIKGFNGIIKEFITIEDNGQISLENTVSVGGLGGDPYRDGTYEYYLSEPIRKNDLKGLGPFIFAAIEMELIEEGFPGAGQKVGLDYHFNKEFRKDWNGNKEQFHYTWEDTQHSGFLWLGDTFRNYGAETVAIKEKPTKANLQDLNVYILVDPDDKKETDAPNFIDKKVIKTIKKWVGNGGTLLVMTNDSAHCDLPHVNELIKVFGLSFTYKDINMVQGREFSMGAVNVGSGNTVFPNVSKVYIKELVTLNTNSAASKILTKDSEVIMAEVKYKNGNVLVVGDPWLYNEYVDGRKIPMEYQNFQAAKDLAKYILSKQ